MRFLFFILLAIFSFTNTWATHIVGGDFYYQYLGGDKYRITMKLYIDCINGNPQAIEGDRTAFFTVFGAGDNKQLQSHEVTRSGPGVKLFGVPYKCVSDVGNVCVDKYEYFQEVVLPKRKGGYIISFERCCRNNPDNIVDPGGTGSTYWVKVPDRDLVDKDNSPIFKKFPPIFICLGFPLVFDHSATDADGDSLSYELYQPYLGASRDDPSPPKPGRDGISNNPAPPPFKHVQWLGNYSTQDQMHGNPVLSIDEETGELTVTPSHGDQFVIGVKVKEWRKGVLIGETLRDYQFNIVNCQSTPIPYFKSEILCTETVKFFDKSVNAENISYDFGDPASGIENNTSLNRNPTHVFTKGGDYFVKQKAWNAACEDEYIYKVKLRIKKGFDIGKDKVYCAPFKHQLAVPWQDFNSILWSTGETKGYITVQKPGTYMVTATYNKCIIRDTITIGYDPISFTPLRDSLFCDKIDAVLEIRDRSPKAKILWSVKDTSAKIRITQEGKYTVRVYNNYCSRNDTANLVLAKITPNLGPNLFICNDFVRTLDAGLLQAGTHYWWEPVQSNERQITVTKPGTYWVTTRLQHCTKTDTIVIDNSKVILEIGPNKHFCDSVRIHLDAGPPNPGTITTYAWSNGETSQKAFIKTPGKHWVTKTDNFGCTNSDTILFFVTLSPVISIGQDTTICLRTPIGLTPGGGFNSYQWDNGSRDKKRYVELGGKYFVTVSDESGCSATDTILVKTDPNKLPNQIYIPNAFTPNGDGLNDLFPFDTPVLQADYNLKIFTRWGEKIYDTKDTRNPWDGTTANKADQLDAYIWVTTYKGCDGKRHTDKGTITILR